MLNIDLDGHASVNVASYEYRINCDTCDQEALIFQVEGNFCLNCWQKRTHPNITPRTVERDHTGISEASIRKKNVSLHVE
jgi:hypothetical protein